MADELAPAPEADATPAAPEGLAPAPTEDTTQPPESESQPLEGQAPADDLEELEVDGIKGRVSRALKDGYLRLQDYTRKTQEAAEARKVLEAERATFAEQAKSFETHAEKFADLRATGREVAEWEKVDWDRYFADRPAEAARDHARYMGKIRERDALRDELRAQHDKWQLEAQRETAKRTEEGRKAIAAKVPGWGTDLEAKLQQYAVGEGFTADEWSGVNDHRAVNVLRKAYLYDQIMARQKQAASAAPAPVPQQPPVGGQRSPTTDLRSLARADDPAAFIAARNKQSERRRA